MSRGARVKEPHEFPRRMKIFLALTLVLLLFGTAGFSILSEASVREASFRTLQTLAFIFEDESSTLERSLEIFLAIVGVFIVWWVLWSVGDMILDGNMREYLRGQFLRRRMLKMKDHIIIVGGGRVGEEIAKILMEKKKQFVIIDNDPKALKNVKKECKECLILQGDALQEDVLRDAGVTVASKIVLTLPKTEANILLTVSAKALNPNIEVHSRCENAALAEVLKRVGAKVVVVPEIAAAKMMSDLE
jgi:voltage-gated potassium channel